MALQHALAFFSPLDRAFFFFFLCKFFGLVLRDIFFFLTATGRGWFPATTKANCRRAATALPWRPGAGPGHRERAGRPARRHVRLASTGRRALGPAPLPPPLPIGCFFSRVTHSPGGHWLRRRCDRLEGGNAPLRDERGGRGGIVARLPW